MAIINSNNLNQVPCNYTTFLLNFHSLVAEDGSCYYRMNLKDWFLNPHPLRQEGVLDGVLRGMVYHNSMMVDGLFSTDVIQRFMTNSFIQILKSLINHN